MKSNSLKALKSVFVICLGCIVIGLINHWYWLIYTGIGIGSAGLLSNRATQLIDYLWMKLAFILGLIVPNIILSAVFYLVLSPIAFFLKLNKKKNLLQLRNESNSTFIQVKKSLERKSFENPW